MDDPALQPLEVGFDTQFHNFDLDDLPMDTPVLTAFSPDASALADASGVHFSSVEQKEDSQVPSASRAGSTRKRKAPTLRDQDWEPYKKRILELHMKPNLTLKDVMDLINQEYGFKANARQYRARLSKWGLDKNIKKKEMNFIAQKQSERRANQPQKRTLCFGVRGTRVSAEKVERWKARTGFVSGDVPETPEDLTYWTASEGASVVGSPPCQEVHASIDILYDLHETPATHANISLSRSAHNPLSPSQILGFPPASSSIDAVLDYMPTGSREIGSHDQAHIPDPILDANPPNASTVSHATFMPRVDFHTYTPADWHSSELDEGLWSAMANSTGVAEAAYSADTPMDSSKLIGVDIDTIEGGELANRYGNSVEVESVSSDDTAVPPAATPQASMGDTELSQRQGDRQLRDLEARLASLEIARLAVLTENERLRRNIEKTAIENEILRTMSSINANLTPRTAPFTSSSTDFYLDVLLNHDNKTPSHRVAVSASGERLLSPGATWDLIVNHDAFKRGLVDVLSVNKGLKHQAKSDGQGPVFEESAILTAIRQSIRSGSDELI